MLDYNTLDVGKIIFDSKIIKILEQLNQEELPIKELAKRLNEQPSSLYYPIKKLLDFDLIKVSKEVRVKNMIEKYYSINQYFSEYKNSLSIEGDVIKNNFDSLVKTVMLEVNQSLKNLQKDIESTKTNGETSTVEYGFVEKKLSYESWKKINDSIRSLIDDFPEEEGEDYRFLISSYKC